MVVWLVDNYIFDYEVLPRMKDKKRTSTSVVNRLKKMIVLENLEKLPSEQELSKKFDVSRTIIREAIRILEYEGITRTVHGSGTFVLKRSSLKIRFNVDFEIETDSAKDVMALLELRSGLERTAIGLVIMKAGDLDLAELADCMEDLSRAIDTRVNLGETDALFHKKIFEISHNEFLNEIFKVVFDGLEILWKSPLGLENFGDAGLPLHKDLFEAIRARNLSEAINVYDRIIELDKKDIQDLAGLSFD